MRADSGTSWPTHRARERRRAAVYRWARRERQRARRRGERLVISSERAGRQMHVETDRPVDLLT